MRADVATIPPCSKQALYEGPHSRTGILCVRSSDHHGYLATPDLHPETVFCRRAFRVWCAPKVSIPRHPEPHRSGCRERHSPRRHRGIEWCHCRFGAFSSSVSERDNTARRVRRTRANFGASHPRLGTRRTTPVHGHGREGNHRIPCAITRACAARRPERSGRLAPSTS